MNELKPCQTSWCDSTRVHTTTYYKSRKDEETGQVFRFVEVDHSCPKCHVRTPQMPRDLADETWNGNTHKSEPEADE